MKKHLRLNRVHISLIIIILLIGAYSWFAISRPLAALSIENQIYPTAISSNAVPIAWPAYGQAAFSINYGKINLSNGETNPQPTASVAKLMLALSVLDKYPISANETGPTITLTEKDAQLYRDYLAKDGSVAPVRAGQKITLKNALTALLLPSANNLADSLADWAFGSMDGYTAYANQKASQMGMNNSHFADASGFSPKTTSTAHDLIILGEATIQNDLLASIVKLKSATIPTTGTVYNTNYLLGESGIYGIKTGNTDQAGGCYVFATDVAIANSDQTVTVVGVILGSPYRTKAINDSVPLINSIGANLSASTVLSAGNVVATYKSDWGQSINAVVSSNLEISHWSDETVKPEIELQNLSASQANNQEFVGSISAKSSLEDQTTNLKLDGKFSQPSIWWRLTHPKF